MFSVENNSVNSPLLRLPAEIRSMIWQCALGTMEVHPAEVENSWYTENGSDVKSQFAVDRQLGLVRTCRQLYAEAGLTFYHNNIFSFQAYSDMARFRLGLRDAQLRAVQTIAISGKILEHLHEDLRSFHNIFCHSGRHSEPLHCPDPFCKGRKLLPDQLTSIIPQLRTLTIDVRGYKEYSQAWIRIQALIELTRNLHGGLDIIVLTA